MRKHNNRHISSDELLEFAEMGDRDCVQQQINKLKRKSNKRAKNREKNIGKTTGKNKQNTQHHLPLA